MDPTLKHLPRLPALLAAVLLPVLAAQADVVTGSVSPAGARVVILDASGKEMAKLGAGPYQLQLPAGRYTARCEVPKAHDQPFLSLNDPVTVNIHCG